MRPNREPLFLLALTFLLLVLSGIAPRDRLTWVLEVLPVLVAMPVLVLTHGAFPLTRLLYWLLVVHGAILMLGGHYTYAQAPPGYWVQDWLNLARNPYDRLGHFAQGFVPAILVREILKRLSPLAKSRWLAPVVVSFCLSFSALYEMFEWWTAALLGQAADEFLGTQGDVWDTQWDMFFTLIGAGVALLSLGTLHDSHLRRLLGSTLNPSRPVKERR